MLSAVDHLHKKGIVHRNIKLKNFLVGETIDDMALIDFKLAKKIKKLKNLDADGIPYQYMAPELI